MRREAITKDMHDRKPNLLFNGVAEERNENTEVTLRNFMKTTLKLTDEVVDNIKFKTVHRLRRPRYVETEVNDTRPPTIIGAFVTMSDRDTCFNARSALYGTNGNIQTDLPIGMKRIRAHLNKTAYELRTRTGVYTRVRPKGIDLVLETKRPEEPNTAWRLHYVKIPDALKQY